MRISRQTYDSYVRLLKEELVPAMGCTEPIALAYGASVARATLGAMPDSVLVEASGNIVKNVKSVVVPNTGGLKGIEAAVAAGLVADAPERKLEVLAGLGPGDRSAITDFLARGAVSVRFLESAFPFDFVLTAEKGPDSVKVRIAKYHTNVVLLERNGEVLSRVDIDAEPACDAAPGAPRATEDCLSVEDIIDFADNVDLDDVRETIARQIQYNMAIACEGVKNDYGANIGKVVLHNYGDDVRSIAKAMAAAGSDARMSGCEMPVVIVSGSGNQGITASVPVIVYARMSGIGDDRLYRALVVSDLLAIHQKAPIGRLSAFCGAVCAGCAAGAAVAYLLGGSYEEVAHTLVNGLATVSGMICDGAKPSCAGKIAASVDAGLLGYYMYLDGQQYRGGDGIVMKGVENTITNVGRLGKEGMRETDKEIVRIMLGLTR